MKFRIYDASSGGTLKWNEDRLVAATQAVQVTNGLFSVQLGDIANTLTPTIFTTPDLYLEVELPTLATATTSSPSWTEGAMSRSKFGSATYAFNSDTLDGLDAGAFSQLSTANAFTNTNSITVASNVNTFVVAGSTNLFRVDTSATSRVVIGTSDTTGTLLVLDEKTGSGDPTGTIGAMYYNSNAGKFRCYQVSAWVDCVGANYALSNLTTTSINQSLIAGTTNSIDLGTSSTTWKTGFFGTALATPAVRPLADGATALQIQNAAGSATYLNIDTVASAVELGSTSLAGKLAISDGSSNYVTLSVNALANDYTISIPTITANDTMCLSVNANCATDLQTAYNISTGTTTPEIKVNGTKGGITIQDADTTIAGTLFSVTQSNVSNLGVALFSVDSTGAVSLGLAGTTTTLAGNVSATGTFSSTGATALFKPSSAVANAFQIQNSSSLAFLSADTSATIVRIGSSLGSDATVLLVLDNTTGAGVDPTGVNGGSYYNSTNNKFRCFQNSIWQDCGNGFNTLTTTADQIATANTTTMQPVTPLGFAVKANTTYAIDAWIPIDDSNAAADVKYTFVIPTAAVITVMTTYYGTTPASTQVICNIVASAQACANTTVNQANHFVQMRGYVSVGANAGTVQFQFAQNTATNAVSFPVIKRGATLSWHQSN